MKPADAILPTAGRAATRRAMLALVRERRAALAGVLALFAGATAVALVGPRLLGVVVDEVVGGRDRGLIDTVAVGFLAVTVLGALLAYLADARAGAVGEEVLASLRSRLLTRTVTLPLATTERAGTGELLSRVIGDVAALTSAVRHAVPAAVLAGVEVVLTAAALVLLSPALAAAALAGVPLGVLGTRWYLRRSPQVYRAERERSAELVTELHESFGGAPTLAAHRLGPARLARLRVAGAAVFVAAMRATVIRNGMRTGVTLGQYVALGAVLGAGAWLLDRGSVTAGAVTAGAFYVLRLQAPVTVLMEVLDRLQTAGAALARIVGVLDLDDPPLPTPAPPRAGTAVSLRGVRFGYRPGREVLHGVDLDVATGQRLALVGPSGAGKSTIAALIAGLHRPGAGEIGVSGPVALLTQEAHTFLGSVAENLRLVAPDASDDDLRSALRTVGAIRWVDGLPDGPATRVGAGGHRLTAAQHQQLGLARLVLADPAVVVLDEATADFDSASAREVERALDAALRGRTVIAIAHRLHAAAVADRVAVVEDGRITESGSHTELLAAGRGYAALWLRWSSHRSTAGCDASRRGHAFRAMQRPRNQR